MRNFVTILALLCVSSAYAEGGAFVRTDFSDTYLGRLVSANPARYQECIDMGPTADNEAGKLCARATRSVYTCATGHQIHCGGYAFNYFGAGCLEREGMVNLLTMGHRLESPTLAENMCHSPGAILVFHGLCAPPVGSREPISKARCKQIMIDKMGQSWFNTYVEGYHGSEEDAMYGQRVGHLEVVAFKSATDLSKLSYVSYVRRSVPASHSEAGVDSGLRTLVACYLPFADAERVIAYFSTRK